MRQTVLSSLCLLLILVVLVSDMRSAAQIADSVRWSSPGSANGTKRAELLAPNEEQIDNSPKMEQAFVGGVPVQCSGSDDSSALIAAVTAALDNWVVIPRGQVCAAGNITIPNLRIEKGGLLKPLKSHTVILADNFQAGDYQVFTNALAGQGTVTLVRAHSAINPLWWDANAKPGTTDMTAAVQAAINATGGRGKIHLPTSTYLITDTLTIPSYSEGFSLLTLEGDGPFLSNIVNRAPPGKPTILLDKQLVSVRNLGIWGAAGFPNDGIKISGAGRIYIESCEIFVNGNGILLENAQSVWIKNNYGSVSSGMAAIPTGAGGGWRWKPDDAFVRIQIPSGGFDNQIVVRDNMNEGYPYQVYGSQATSDIANSVTIQGNQGEGSTSGIYLRGFNNFTIADNYLGEGSSGYAIELQNCRFGHIGPNYLHLTSFTAKNSTVKLTDVLGTVLEGNFNTIWLNGSTEGLIISGGLVNRLIDESTDKLYGLFNVGIGDLRLPNYTFNVRMGSAEWRASSTSIIAYPGARLGDKIWKTSPVPGESPGWICTTAAATGALVRLTGNGPDPVILPDYYNSTAYDFRITITTPGAVGTAAYKIEYKTASDRSYTNLVTNVTTTEVPRMINEVLGGVFTIKWPAGTYAMGSQWTLTAVVRPEWTPLR